MGMHLNLELRGANKNKSTKIIIFDIVFSKNTHFCCKITLKQVNYKNAIVDTNIDLQTTLVICSKYVGTYYSFILLHLFKNKIGHAS